MLNVYYPNAMLLVILVVEALREYAAAFRGSPAEPRGASAGQLRPAHSADTAEGGRLGVTDSAGSAARAAVLPLLARHFVFAAITFLCLLPTFITRYFIYGSPFATGYGPVQNWAWRSPRFLAVLFSSEHGFFSWT